MFFFVYVGLVDLFFFDLFSIFGKFWVGFGVMGLRFGVLVSLCLEVFVFELINVIFLVDNFCVVIYLVLYICIKMKKFGKMFC